MKLRISAAVATWNQLMHFCLLMACILIYVPAFAENEGSIKKILVGAWDTLAINKEAEDTETIFYYFNQDGTYRTRRISKLFGEAKHSANGRYSISNATKTEFTLKIDVSKGDPDMDKDDTTIIFKVRLIDSNTLQAEDGQIVRRVK